MEINYNSVSLVDTLGLVQGLILGSLLLVINRRKKKSTIYLGLFILAYSLELLPSILEDLNILEYYPELNALPFDFIWLLFPLFYVYVQKVSILSNEKTSYWVLYPGIVFFILRCILFFQPVERKLDIEDSLWFNLLILLGLFYSFWIGILTVRWINRHIREVENQFASLEYKQLRWARLFVIFGLVFTILYLLAMSFLEGGYFSIVFSSINVMLLYWISLKGILQYNVKSVMPDVASQNYTEAFPIDESHSENPSDKTLEALVSQLNEHFLNTEAFAQKELTINDVAESLSVHPKRLSTAINTVRAQNFNSYVNEFRIKKAQELIKNGATKNMSYEGIGVEVGFQSKSTFFASFKKVTGTTPSRFKAALSD